MFNDIKREQVRKLRLWRLDQILFYSSEISLMSTVIKDAVSWKDINVLRPMFSPDHLYVESVLPC